MMKNNWVKYFLSLILILLFPLLLNLLCYASIKITAWLKIPQIIQFSNLSTIEFSDYATIVISLFSCLSVLWVGYMTYQLSQSVQEYSLKQDKADRQYALAKLLLEISYNAPILERHVKMLGSEPELIRVEAYGLIEKVASELPVNTLTELFSLYRMFQYYKENGSISNDDINRWFTDDKAIRTMDLIDKLTNRGMT